MTALGYEEYFSDYVSEHRRPATRWTHFAAAHLVVLAAAVALLRRRPAIALALPLAGGGAAGIGHLLIEHRPPAILDHPLWSLRAGLRMIAMMWQGRDDELTRIARDHRRSR